MRVRSFLVNLAVLVLCTPAWMFAAEANCSKLKLGVSPLHISADHAAKPPGNQVHFRYGYVDVPEGCASPMIAFKVNWSVLDPTAAQIDQEGVATCRKATRHSIKVIAKSNGSAAIAKLTCR